MVRYNLNTGDADSEALGCHPPDSKSRQDLQSAIQSSQESGNDIDYAALFQNFRPGR
jgi:hypothetical protein